MFSRNNQIFFGTPLGAVLIGSRVARLGKNLPPALGVKNKNITALLLFEPNIPSTVASAFYSKRKPMETKNLAAR